MQEDFTEGAMLLGHEEGGLVNNFRSSNDFKNFGEMEETDERGASMSTE